MEWRSLPSCSQVLQVKRHTSSSSEENMRTVPASAKEYVESLHQNAKSTLLYGKNNVMVQPVSVSLRPQSGVSFQPFFHVTYLVPSRLIVSLSPLPVSISISPRCPPLHPISSSASCQISSGNLMHMCIRAKPIALDHGPYLADHLSCAPQIPSSINCRRLSGGEMSISLFKAFLRSGIVSMTSNPFAWS